MLRKLRIALILVCPLIVTTVTATATAQEPTCAPSAEPSGCAKVSLWPDTLSGDYFIGETVVAQEQNPAYINVASATTQAIDITNITSSEDGYGELFVYDDAQVRAWVAEGNTRSYTAYPRRRFIRGMLNVTCAIRQAAEDDDIGCEVSVDGVPQGIRIEPGQRETYILELGAHEVMVAPIGASAHLWSPESHTETVYTRAGGTSYVNSYFNKQGHLTITMDQPGVTADLYVDGELVATQAASAEMWVAPFRTYRVEAKNITDPAAGEIYGWRDSVAWTYVGPGQERMATLRLTQVYTKGYLDIVCEVTNVEPGEDPVCLPTIDGLQVAPVANGATATHVVEPGYHDVTVLLEPTEVFNTSPFTTRPWVTAGSTSTITAHFTIEREPAISESPTSQTNCEPTGGETAPSTCINQLRIQVNSEPPRSVVFDEHIHLQSGDVLSLIDLGFCTSEDSLSHRVAGEADLLLNGVDRNDVFLFTKGVPIVGECGAIGNFMPTWTLASGSYRVDIALVHYFEDSFEIDDRRFFFLDVE
jgi:hypothetical protein